MKSNNTTSKDVYSFSLSEFEIIVGNYFHIVVTCIWLILLIWETLWRFKTNFSVINLRFPAFSIWFILPIFFIPTLLLYLFLLKFAYRIIFDFGEGKVTFFLFQRKKPVVLPINDLEIVKITWHTYFIFKNGRKIWYQGDPDLFGFLREKNIYRKWGAVSKVLLRKEYKADSSYHEKGLNRLK